MLAIVLLIVHALISAGLIFMVLQEMEKFSELGGAFGGGSFAMFGRRKGLDTSGKITVGLAITFFAMCFLVSWVISR